MGRHLAAHSIFVQERYVVKRGLRARLSGDGSGRLAPGKLFDLLSRTFEDCFELSCNALVA